MKAGITGHQNLGEKPSVEWVATELRKLISEFHVDLGYSSLAIGADQLFASLLMQERIPYKVIIPSRGYKQTFKRAADRERYETLLKASEGELTLRFSYPEERAYFAAGKHVVDSSEILFAVWNGKKAKGLGGTADIVGYALSKRKKVVHLNPLDMSRRNL